MTADIIQNQFIDFIVTFKYSENANIVPGIDSHELGELKNIGGLTTLVSLFSAITGDNPYQLILSGPAVKAIYSLPINNNYHSPDVIASDLVQAADKLKDNAGKPKPLPISIAVPQPHYRAIIKEIARLKIEVTVIAQTRSYVIPVIEMKCFSEYKDQKNEQKKIQHLITGMKRDWVGNIGHVLNLSIENIEVQLPTNDPYWRWENIRGVLETKHYFVGNIMRTSGQNNVWVVSPGARIIPQDQPKLDFVERTDVTD